MTLDTLRQAVLEEGSLPVHIAIIMDGNGRWAKQRSLPRVAGHREGINSVREITRVCGELGIKHLTLYTFSAENWARPRQEVSALMSLLLNTIKKEVAALNKNNVRLTAIGALETLPKAAQKGLRDGMELTRDNTGLNLNLALSYGGRQEIVRALRKIVQDVQDKVIEPESISEELLGQYLYTAHIPDPDLLIRTGGEYRVSNFLLWQIAYTELYVTPQLWPAFREQQLLEAIQDYQHRERRFGLLSEQVRKKR
jgi:undecaprenyl diphosphate synthase